jgi:transposase
VCDAYLLAIDQAEGRLADLDAQLTAYAATEPYKTPVAWLRCFRGIETLTAMVLVAELHDFRRFQSARALMAYVGLVPTESSTGDHHWRGPITKMGNSFVRRVLIETGWHYQHRPGVGPALAARRRGQPARVIAIADRAQQRLCQRFRRLRSVQKAPGKIVVAVARELVGFLWAVMQPVTP